jgi:hypothetical protein
LPASSAFRFKTELYHNKVSVKTLQFDLISAYCNN